MVTPSQPLQHLFLSTSDLTVATFIAGLLLCSLFSFVFILHFHLKTKRSRRLKDFNSLWTVRILLVSFISLWAVTEFLRIPLVHRKLFSSDNQIYVCRYQVVLSQGLFQPGFLVTLLFLVNFSIKTQNPEDTFGSAVAIVFALCVPILLLQVFFVLFASRTFFSPLLWRTSVVVPVDGGESDLVLCLYPLFGTIIFGTFASVYLLVFLLSCWKVVSLVINKGLRVRIYTLASATVFALAVEIICLALSSLWMPDRVEFEGVALIVFLSVLLCAVVGEGILVIRPIADALSVGKESFRLDRLPVSSTEKTVVLGQR